MFYLIAFLLLCDVAVARDATEQAQVSIDNVEAPQKREAKKAEPPVFSKYDALQDSLQMELIKDIDTTLAYLNKTVKELPRKSRPRLDLYIRIMNLSLEQAAYVGGREEQDFSKAFDAWIAGGKKGPMPRQGTSKSSVYWRALYQLSVDVMNEYPTSPGVDRVLYIGTLGLQYLGQEEQAARGFHDILRRFPRSPVVPDSAFSLGEYYFNSNQFQKAVPFYQKAQSFPNSRKEGWSSFKLAWCYYNLQQHAKALNYWKRTVSYSNHVKAGGKLRDEALRDMVNAWAELRQVDQAIDYYKQNSAGEYLPVLMKLLAQAFADQGNFAKAIEVSKRLIRTYPQSQEAFTVQVEMLDLCYGLQNYDLLFNEVENLNKLFGPGSEWMKKQEPDDAKTSAERIRKLSLYYPKLIHKSAQKTKNRRGLEAAARGYLIYMHRYPHSLDIAELSEYLGDIEYFKKNFGLAGKYYFDITNLGDRAAIYDDKGKVRTNIHQRSAKNMIDAYNQDFAPELARLERIKPNFKANPQPLSSKARNFVKACELYTKWYPNDVTTVKNCDVYTAEVYYRNADKKPALQHLWHVATKYNKTKQGLAAAESIMSIVAREEEEALSAAKKLLTIPEYEKSPLGAKLKELIRNEYLTKVKKEPSSYKRGGLYEAQARAQPQDKEADKLWNNAAAEYLKAGAIDRAVNAYQELIRRYPNSVAYSIALLQLAQILEGQIDFQNSSRYYQAYAAKYPGEAAAKTAKQKSCYLLIASHKEEAINVCRAFARSNPQYAEAALSRLINYLSRTQQSDLMLQVIERDYLPASNVTANQKIIALRRVIMASGAQSGQSANARGKMLAIYNGSRSSVSGQALRYIGEIVFAQSKPQNDKVLAMRLAGGTAPKLQGSIQALLKETANLEKSYGRLFETQDSYWGVAGFYQLGYAYENFAGKLLNPPALNGVKPADVKAQLAGSVGQLQKKAQDYYQQAWQTAQRFSIASDWTAKVYNGISRLSNSKVEFLDWVYEPDFLAAPSVDELKSAVSNG